MRLKTVALGLFLSAGALTLSCGGEDSNSGGGSGSGAPGGGAGGSTAGSPAIGGNGLGGTPGTGGSNGGTAGSETVGGNENSGGATQSGGAPVSDAGAPSNNGGVPNNDAGAPNNGGAPSNGGAPGNGGTGTSIEGGAGGAGGVSSFDCSGVMDGQACDRPAGLAGRCDNADGEICLCQGGQNRQWNCFGGVGGAPGTGAVECGNAPVDDGDCTGFGVCPGAPGCVCFNQNVNCF